MGNSREELLERVSRSIDIMQDIHADSRTPRAAAMKLVDPIRALTDYRRALRKEIFIVAADNPAYATAVASLKQVTDTLATDLVAHERHMQFVSQAAQAAAAVFKVAIAVGAVVGI